MNKYKARFLAKGFSHNRAQDYDETFAPLAKYTSIRAIISLVSSMGWSLHHIQLFSMEQLM
jgi:hypothetical protein